MATLNEIAKAYMEMGKISVGVVMEFISSCACGNQLCIDAILNPDIETFEVDDDNGSSNLIWVESKRYLLVFATAFDYNNDLGKDERVYMQYAYSFDTEEEARQKAKTLWEETFNSDPIMHQWGACLYEVYNGELLFITDFSEEEYEEWM